MTCGGRSLAGPERGSEILCVLTHGMGSTPPPPLMLLCYLAILCGCHSMVRSPCRVDQFAVLWLVQWPISVSVPIYCDFCVSEWGGGGCLFVKWLDSGALPGSSLPDFLLSLAHLRTLFLAPCQSCMLPQRITQSVGGFVAFHLPSTVCSVCLSFPPFSCRISVILLSAGTRR